MPCPNKKIVRSYLTAGEYDIFRKTARSAGLSLSQFVREVGLGNRLQTFEHEEFKLELMKTRADLGRLGGLLKAALAQPPCGTDFSPQDWRDLLAKIGQCQKTIREAVSRL